MTDDQERITTAIGLDQENSSAVAVEEDEPETSLKKSPSSDLAAIKRKLSIAGLTDQASSSGSATVNLSSVPSKYRMHRRSRSLGEVVLPSGLSIAPDRNSPTTTTTRDTKKPISAPRSLKPSIVDVSAESCAPGLEQIKRQLLQEIKIKLKEQIESKECHSESNTNSTNNNNNEDFNEVDNKADDDKEQSNEIVQVTEQEEVGVEKEKELDAPASRKIDERPTLTSEEISTTIDNDEQVNQESDAVTPLTPLSPTISADCSEAANKRFSICSLSSGGNVELRKRYSPVYERTRKIVRQSSSSINRWSSSQPQVVPSQQQQGATTKSGEAAESVVASKGPPSSPSGTDGTVAILSPVASKGELEGGEEEEVKRLNGTAASEEQKKSSSRNVEFNSSSSTRIGPYSAHPSVYVIEQDRRIGASSGLDESRSDKMDKSTNTLKRGGSFRGLKKGIKKTFSTTIPALTLEKADKAPDSNVPAIVVCCVETLRKKRMLKTEGLYRSSPSQLEVRKVIKHARKGQYDYVTAVNDPVILAGTVKSFFFNLKYHIIGEEIMQKHFPKKCLLGNSSESEYLERLKGLIVELDTTHYESLEYVVKHLQEVATFSKFNLMTPSNLGVVWAPCLFTNSDADKSLSGADLISFMGEQTRLLELLIVHADLLFDRYTLDEIMIAIEDGYSPDALREDESTLNLRPNFDVLVADGREFERRKLLRNLSLTLDNLCEASETTMPAAPTAALANNGEKNGNGVRHYDLQNSYTVPVMGMNVAQSDGTMGGHQKMMKMKRSRSRAVCVVS